MSRQIGYSVVKCGSSLLNLNFKNLCSASCTGVILRNQEVNLSSLKRPLVGQTSLFLQDGTTIQELPVVVRNLHGNDIDIVCCTDRDHPSVTEGSESSGDSIVAEDDSENREMVAGFERCYSAKGVFKLLELIPAEEVSPEVALQALKSIFRLENNLEFRNWVGRGEPEEKAENFTRAAVLSNLVGVVAASEHPKILLDGLQTVSRDVGSNRNETTAMFREQLSEQVLLMASEGRLTVLQVCDAVRAFALLDRKNHGDKMWTGLIENSQHIDKSNIVDVFRTLPYLSQSRRLVFRLAERRLADVWSDLNGENIRYSSNG